MIPCFNSKGESLNCAFCFIVRRRRKKFFSHCFQSGRGKAKSDDESKEEKVKKERLGMKIIWANQITGNPIFGCKSNLERKLRYFFCLPVNGYKAQIGAYIICFLGLKIRQSDTQSININVDLQFQVVSVNDYSS